MHPTPHASSTTVPSGPQWNALKHGLRSTRVLLPGDDVSAFLRLRRELFTDYRPATRDEADHVEAIAGYKWRIAHCQTVQAAFRAALHSLVIGGPAGHICEPDPHRWQHRAMDCGLEELRLNKLMERDRRALLQLQWARRNRLVEGVSGEGRDWRTFLAEGEPPAEPNAASEAPQTHLAASTANAAPETPAAPTSSTPASDSTDRPDGNSRERGSDPFPASAEPGARGEIPMPLTAARGFRFNGLAHFAAIPHATGF
jgi:hypothetical protein